ncbi:dihydroneopterin aldolase [Campylobacter sp. TTU-622]|uniref:dihydroneopterin aldolase n=1 Tax=unclassified Campylobacter TaxID=2593542 RepID=UPI00190851DD|nr:MULTISPECIES: dihydroneopterin aldolase [unclassified Campylobacter]MBK1972044.1 dihydroneopterin aldolase [Campylobacter sp. TTU_617]MBK1973157.1 dihydroneopterin aldolase [Campylobacter sp. TTU-622]
MQDYIISIKTEFKCIIGILDFERKKKQKVIIKLKAKSYEFLDYSILTKKIKKYYKKNKFYTIEESLKFVSIKLKEKIPSLYSLKISVFKPKIIKKTKAGVLLKKKY